MTRNDFILKVINDQKQLLPCINHFENGCHVEYRTSYSGLLDEKILLLLINKSKKNGLIMRFLNAFVMYLDSEEITAKVFAKLTNIHGKYKRSLLIGLAHCDLSLFQLFILNQQKIDEALVKLTKAYEKREISKTDIDVALSYWDQSLGN